jgi:HD-like signal output (HDOD) protein
MNNTLIERIKTIENLPSLPMVAQQVLNLSRKKDLDLTTLRSVLENDPALTAKILRLVNSPLFGSSRQVADLDQAMVILGLRSVKMTALGFSLVDTLHQQATEEFDYIGFWRRSFATAHAARLIAEQLNNALSEICFTSGLLCDIGILAAWQWTEDLYSQVLIRRNDFHENFPTAEQACLGLTHETLANELLTFWSLPEQVCRAIATHHQPLEPVTVTSDKQHVINNMIRAASLFAESFIESDATTFSAQKQMLCENLPLDEQSLAAIEHHLHKRLDEAAFLFNLNTGQNRHYTDIQMEANMRLAKLCSTRQILSPDKNKSYVSLSS